MTMRVIDDGLEVSISTSVVTNTAGYYGTVDQTNGLDHRVTVGVDIDNYSLRKARGDLLPHTSFTQFDATWRASPGTWRRIRKSDNFTVQAVNNIPTPFRFGASDWLTGAGLGYGIPPTDHQHMQYLVQKAAARIYSQGWDILTFSSELPKLRRMFSSIARKLSNISKGISRERLLEMWAEGRYGWRTLAFDIRDLSNALQDWQESRDIYSERFGYTTSKFLERRSDEVDSLSGIRTEFVETFHVTTGLRGAVSARISPPRFIVDPLKTGWELTRLSFILDWLIDVGSAIDAFQFLRASSEHTASYGLHHVIIYDAYIESISSSASYTLEYSGSASGSYELTERVPSEVSSIPQLTNRPLTWDMLLDLTAISRIRKKVG